MLSMLFQQFPGFAEVRMVEAKPCIAFVEFSKFLTSTNERQKEFGDRGAAVNAM